MPPAAPVLYCAMDDSSPFKVCATCGQTWTRRDEFLSDPAIRPIGYQMDLANLTEGFFLFNHEACGTTLAIAVRPFLDLSPGPFFRSREAARAGCPAYCLQQLGRSACPRVCECHTVRDILRLVSEWPKRPAAAARVAPQGGTPPTRVVASATSRTGSPQDRSPHG